MDNYLIHNKHSWNERVDTHLSSDFYNMKGFLKGETSLREIELALLGDIRGKRILHLQCHFGQDSLSMSRMGATVTGVDLSDKAIDNARKINDEIGENAQFICCDVYSLPEHLDEQFDIVYTSYGTIGWLPDITKWANIVQRYLKTGGQFVFAEFHPVVWMMDEDFKEVKYRYFNSDAIVEKLEGTYTDPTADLNGTEVSWNHAMAEVVGALLSEELTLLDMQEYDYSPWDCFKHSTEVAPNRYRIKHLDNKIPLVYSLVFEK